MPNLLPQTYADLVHIDDMDPFAAETTSDLQNLAQDILHLLVELPGSNPDDPDRGIGIEQYLSGSETVFRTLPGLIDAQIERDDRVTDSVTTLETLPTGGFRVSIKISVGNDIIPLAYGVSGDGVVQI